MRHATTSSGKAFAGDYSGLANPSIKACLTYIGATPMIFGAADFAKLIADEIEGAAKCSSSQVWLALRVSTVTKNDARVFVG